MTTATSTEPPHSADLSFSPDAHLRSIRLWLALFIVGLVLSGVTAFPLVHETALLVRLSSALALPHHAPAADRWIRLVAGALSDTSARYPFLAYGTDWLAFGHLVIAAAFIPTWRDPVRNRSLIDVGLLACVGVFALALIAGPVRAIPPFWRVIDCSFGLFGAIPLLIVRRHLRALETVASYRVTIQRSSLS